MQITSATARPYVPRKIARSETLAAPAVLTGWARRPGRWLGTLQTRRTVPRHAASTNPHRDPLAGRRGCTLRLRQGPEPQRKG